jgi:hypothetical protein
LSHPENDTSLRSTKKLNPTKQLVLILCTAAFLIAQFWSFAAAATLLGSIDIDPRNDICLEDVISVDPFVGGSCGSSRSEGDGIAIAGLGFVASEQAVFAALFLVALLAGYDQPQRSLSALLAELQYPSGTVAVRELIGKLQV